MSLRWKLMTLLAVVSAVTATFVGLVSYESMQSRLYTEIDRSLVQATDRFLDDPNGNRRVRNGDRLSIAIPERPLGIEQFVVQVSDEMGEVIATTPGVTLPVQLRTMDDAVMLRSVTSDEGDRFRVRSVVVRLPGTRPLVVGLGRSLAETDNVLADLRMRIFLIGAGVAAIAAMIGALISSGVTSRIRRLSRAAERIARTSEFEVELSVDGNDETARLARSFRDMVEALRRSRDQQQRLVQDAGHELRTPLTSLRTNIDVLRRHQEIPFDVRQQILDDLERDGAELSALVNEIVAVAAHLDGGSGEVFEEVNVGDIATSVVERARRRSGRDIRVIVDRSIVMGRPASIERAMSNLLDNALKFDTGSEPIEVEVSAGTFAVRDRGPGIPEEDLERVFERFHRSAEARSLPGSGLGLAIVADMTNAHGGRYFARRRVGHGAEVGFSLPLKTLTILSP